MGNMTEVQVTRLPISQKIQRALDLWHRSQASAGPNFAVLRAFEHLPEYCGFDIDVIVAANKNAEASAAAVKAGHEAGLLAYTQKKSGRSAKVVWLDPTLDPTHRQWILLDISSDLSFGPHRITLDDLTVETWENGDFRCTVPTEEWRLTLSVLRGLATLDQKQCELKLGGSLTQLSHVLGHSAVTSLSAIAQLELPARRAEAMAQWRKTHGFNLLRNHSPHSRLTARGRLSRFVFFRFFYWERHQPPFIVFTGADGVGKTTLIAHLQILLDQYPMGFDTFHHLAPMKTKSWQPHPNSRNFCAPNSQSITITRKLAQILWHYFIPNWARRAIVGINGEVRYASRLNFKIGTSFFSGHASLVDRYVFDRLTRLEIDQRHPLQNWVGRLNCRFMRRPRLAILLSDKPNLIHARKAQLSVDAIQQYEQRIRELIAQTRTPLADLPVAGLLPEDLAQKALRLTFDALSSDIPALVTAWDREHRKKKHL